MTCVSHRDTAVRTLLSYDVRVLAMRRLSDIPVMVRSPTVQVRGLW